MNFISLIQSIILANLNWYSIINSKPVGIAYRILLIFVLFFILRYLLYKIIKFALAPVMITVGEMKLATSSRVKTIHGLLKSIVNYVLIFISLIAILKVIGYDPTGFLATAGIIGLAIGFGAQKLVKDVISGFFILIENQYSVGDYITIGAVTGTVETVAMRTTSIRDDSGRLFFISNGDITQVCSYSKGILLASVDIAVPMSTNVDDIRKIIEGLSVRFENIPYLSEPRIQGIVSIGDGKMVVRVIANTTFKDRVIAEMVLREEVRKTLINNDIIIL